MKLAINPADKRQWMVQWHQAATALEEFRWHELQALTDANAWQQIEAVLSLAGQYPRPSSTSGLVEQQAWFRQLRVHE